MNDYDKALDFATSEAMKFLREIKTTEMRDNVRYLRMALNLLEKELDEELQERRSCAGLGEIPKIQTEAEAKHTKDQERADSISC